MVRSRAAVIAAARTLFLRNGYAGTTMEEVAEAAGLTKRTVYNIYSDKSALFSEIVADVMAFAERFARELPAAFREVRGPDPGPALHGLGRRLALAILRPEVIALRRLLIREAGTFPELGAQYFERAPGRVLVALTEGFAGLHRARLLRTEDPRRAAEQFAYLVVGAPLDRAMLVGTVPGEDEVISRATDGVDTFLARYRVPRKPAKRSR